MFDMSYQCPNCPKKLSSKQRLQTHLDKRIPCDFKCRHCDFKCDNRHKFYRHIKKEHNDTGVEVVEAMPFVITPIEDYKIIEGVFDTDMGEVTVTIRPRTLQEEVIMKKRLLQLSGLLRESSGGALIQVMKHLDDSRTEYIPYSLGALLSMVHIRPETPQFHSICLTDINRRSVSFYSRTHPVNDMSCKWIVYPQETSLQMLTHHAHDLFSYLLHTGIAALEIKVLHNDIVFIMKAKNTTLLIRYDRAYNDIVVKTGIYKDLTECPASRSVEAANLLNIIEERKEQLLEEIKQVMPSRKDIAAFLDRGRPICYPSLLRTLE